MRSLRLTLKRDSDRTCSGVDEEEAEELSNCGKEAEEKTREECSQGGMSKFRTIDGSCNNPDHPHWGQASTAFQRVLAPEYEDGKYGFSYASGVVTIKF